MIHLVGQSFNARETIQNVFPPLVGVISSPLADEVCHRNNLTFVELLQPFTKLQNDAHFRDVSGTSVSIRGLHLNVCDVDWRPPQTVLARKMLNDSVTNAQNDKTKFIPLGSSTVGLEIPTNEPWFEQWRETFLTVQFPADHEFTRHFLSCLLIVSSADPNIVETAHKLSQKAQQMQAMTPQKLPKWFHPADVLNSYVVLHEGSQGDISKAQQSFELLKSTFGDSKCFLVQLNSLDPAKGAPVQDYWAPYIRRHTKADTQPDPLSGPKTPQDSVSVISMPTMQMSALMDTANSDNEIPILHPLSPVQENAMEAINSKFSVSSESIASQNINPNVWSHEFDQDAPHGSCLNANDIENIRHFVQDYTVRALIPYVEHLVSILNEAITTKKGVSKSFLSATKRWFVTSKPGAGVSNQNAVIYTHESAELQTRKLGDLYFMFGHYNLAFQAYHQAKRDFNADSAWQYYAGALEMAAVSAFMQGTANRKTYDYMEDAIVCYLTVCKLQQFATRATLLSVECLKSARFFGEAAKQLIRMTSEESDLRSALLLEQAAYCYLASQPSMSRKYAFHIVLAGNRYSRAGQRKHAYRCYRQAQQVFQNRGWSLAEDHIQYTTAKHAYTLKKLDEASQSFAHLLRPGSQQNSQQQASFLKEYIQTQNELFKRSSELGLLAHALPHVLQDSIRVLISANPTSAPHHQYIPANNVDIRADLKDEHLWHKLEEMLVTTAASGKPFVFKPSQSLYTREKPALESPLAVQGEPIELAVTLSNTIRCSISMSGIDVLWKLKLDNEETLSNECLFVENQDNPNKAAVSVAIKTTCTEAITLGEHTQQTVFFKITPKLTGLLQIIGVVGRVAATAEPDTTLLGSLYFEAQRPKNTAATAASSLSAKQLATQSLLNNKLSIRIIQPLPILSVGFSPIPKDLLSGEIVPVTISLRNLGIQPIEEIYVGCDNPRWFTLLDRQEAQVPLSILSSFKDLSNEKLVKDKEIRRQHAFRLLRKADNGAALAAQEAANVSLSLQAPYKSGEFVLRLLFYYSFAGSAANSPIKYRLVRHTWKFTVHECVHSEVTCVINNKLTRELSLSVNVRNQSAAAGGGELPSELYINELGLYSEEYALNPNKFYQINRMEITSGQAGDKCITSSKSSSFECCLQPKPPAKDTQDPEAILRSRISSMAIMPCKNFREQNTLPDLKEMYSFLVKQETTFFNPKITTEDFNAAVATYDRHATVILSWTVVLGAAKSGGGGSNSGQRIAHGQNFVQLRHLYETSGCGHIRRHPTFKSILLDNQPPLQHISDFADASKSPTGDNNLDGDHDDEEQWEENDNCIGRRCLLEDESVFLAAAALKA